jgi:tetratricopeptide (TPR) repeat protein
MNFTSAGINNLKNNKWWHIALLVILPAIIYVQSVKFDYTNFDDNGIILQKFDVVGNIKNIDTLYRVDAFFNSKGDFYRPIQNLTFMLDAQVSHEKLWMFHITNLLIHIFTCIALYFFLQLLNLKRYTSFLLALLFAVHPLFASNVGWVPARGDTLIGLLGVLLFITFNKCFGKRKILWFVLHSFVFFLIIFTKETTILFPLLLLYYYFFVLRQPKDFTSIKSDIKKLFPFFILWITVCVSYLILRQGVAADTGATIDVLGIIPFFKNNTIIPIIIGKFFVPFRLSTFPLYDNISTIIGIAFLLGILYITYEYSIQKKWAVLMGLLWFIFFAVPPTIYRLPNADTFFNYLEHRAYLPMIGIVIITGFFLNDRLTDPVFAKYFNRLYVPVIVLFGILAWLHCADYTNDSTLRERAANLNNPAALSGRAGELLSKGDTLGALTDMNKAIQLNPTDASMYFERGKVMARMQRHELAEENFTLALNLQPNSVDILLARSVERRALKRYESAFRDIFQAANLDSTNPKIYYSFGNLFVATKNYPDAITAFSKCISLQPLYGEAYNNRAYAKILSGDYEGAVKDCDSALKFIPTNAIVFNNKGHAFAALNKPDSAFINFDKAIALNKSFAEAYFERGKAKQQFNDSDGACKDWSQAIELGYNDTTKLIDKYCRH